MCLCSGRNTKERRTWADREAKAYSQEMADRYSPHPGCETRETVEEFIRSREHVEGELVVATGYTSVAGLAWLADVTTRPVTVVVGDLRPERFENAAAADRRKAVGLLERAGSRVFCWYRQGRIAHGKAFAFRKEGQTVAALAGSANLTLNGLRRYAEIMVTVDTAEFDRIDGYIDSSISGGRDRTDNVVGLCRGPGEPGPPRPRGKADASAAQPSTRTQKEAKSSPSAGSTAARPARQEATTHRQPDGTQPSEAAYKWRRGSNIAAVVAGFIRAHQHDNTSELVVATGRTSAWGLGWLARNTTGPVTVVVGDMRSKKPFRDGHDDDKRKAVELLKRPGSRAVCWSQKHPVEAIAHGKAVVFRRNGNTVAALAGSADLTRNGLYDYAEMMVPVASAGFGMIDCYINRTAGSGQDVTDRLIGLCRSRSETRPTGPPSKPKTRRRARLFRRQSRTHNPQGG